MSKIFSLFITLSVSPTRCREFYRSSAMFRTEWYNCREAVPNGATGLRGSRRSISTRSRLSPATKRREGGGVSHDKIAIKAERGEGESWLVKKQGFTLSVVRRARFTWRYLRWKNSSYAQQSMVSVLRVALVSSMGGDAVAKAIAWSHRFNWNGWSKDFHTVFLWRKEN